MVAIKQWLMNVAAVIRQLSGDDAYERYVQHHSQCHGDQPMLDRRAFYIEEQQRKWSGIKRCC
jgi:uncharacterized short protein YbdD (DUF466 family)